MSTSVGKLLRAVGEWVILQDYVDEGYPTYVARGWGTEARPAVVLGGHGHSMQDLWTHVPPGLTESRSARPPPAAFQAQQPRMASGPGLHRQKAGQNLPSS